ncbi:DNA polymerase-3 subunit gamma/tau [Peptoniphilus olsenii]|uniref:DNA-directed DNA polymerase n=1 Tax=Peptoniphilus olsenii TaxID=411570 RepID=A0ABV2JBP2_9FIRM
MYKALYRKYRSKTFDELYGQEAVVASLKNQVKNNELNHAYIFSGTRGTGKTSAAKILARAVNCLNPKDGNPCNECENCKSILEDRAMDVVEMDAASNNGVDDIRELKEKVIYPPTKLKYKVYIIDEVHMLSKGAFNALLKILEEPPAHLIFILATTELEKIPPTIMSRAQKFSFKRISNEDIVDNLKKITKLENKICDDEVFNLVAKSSDGAMRDALSVLDQLLTIDKDKIEVEDAMKILGISSNKLIFELTDALIDKDHNKGLELIDEIARAGIDFSILINQLLGHFRDLMLVKTLRQPEKIVFSTYLKDFDLQSHKIEMSDLLEIIELLTNLSVDMRYAENKRVLVEMTVIKISMRYGKKEIISRIEELENKINSNNFTIDKKESSKAFNNKNAYSNEFKENATIKEKTKTPQLDKSHGENNKDKVNYCETQNIEKGTQSDIIKEDVSIEDIQKNWPNILQEVKVKKLPLFSYLKEGVPTSFTNNVLEIDFSNTNIMFYKMCNNDENKEVIAQVFEAIYGFRIEARFIFKQTKANNKLEDLFGKDNIEEI